MTASTPPPGALPTGFWMWVPIIRDPDVTAALADINTKLEHMMSTFDAQLLAAQQTTADLIATDAATDAQQASDLTDQLAAQLASALEMVQNPPVTPPPVEPPVDEPPVDPTV